MYHWPEKGPVLTQRTRIVYFITSLEIGGSERQLAALVKGLPSSLYEKHVIGLSAFVPALEKSKTRYTTHYDSGMQRNWRCVRSSRRCAAYRLHAAVAWR